MRDRGLDFRIHKALNMELHLYCFLTSRKKVYVFGVNIEIDNDAAFLCPIVCSLSIYIDKANTIIHILL